MAEGKRAMFVHPFIQGPKQWGVVVKDFGNGVVRVKFDVDGKRYNVLAKQ